MNNKFTSSAIVSLLLLSPGLYAQTSPESFLGHQVGADRKLADYNQIRAYFRKLDDESDKIKVVTIGQSTRGEPMIMAIITSEENHANLDHYRQITKRLSDPRNLSPAEAKRLSQKGRVIVVIQTGLHAQEIGHAQHSMELAHKLVTGVTQFDARRVLDEVIVLLIPVANPDGQLMETGWYRKNLGTKYEGGPMPWLYHHYAGHDNNRDGVVNNLVETRAISRVLWRDWFPQAYYDHHQPGGLASSTFRIFIPPFLNPADPNIHPLIFSGVDLIGSNMVYDLQKEGRKGIVHNHAYASAWWKGTLTSNAMVHNITAVFTETASPDIATPVYIDPNEIAEFYTRKSLRFPDPWPGGWWRLRDTVEYMLSASLSYVETAAQHRENLLYNFYKMGKDAVEVGRPGDPFAFVIPSEQADYPTALKTLEYLQFGGAEIHRARDDFVADGATFPAGSFVILTAQPYRPYVVNILGERKYPSGVPNRLGDNASHALPTQMGVAYRQIDQPFEAPLEELTNIPYPSTPAPSSPYVVLDTRANAAYAVAIALLAERVEVARAINSIDTGTTQVPAGSFIVRNTPAAQRRLPALLDKWHLTALELNDSTGVRTVRLRNPRIGLYQSWRSNMDEGWTRFVLDDFGFPYTTLHNADLDEDLRQQFDVIVFADENPDVIKTGFASRTRNISSGAINTRSRSIGAYPPEYGGGIGVEGITALKTFVGNGGVLVALDNAGPLFIKEFNLPVRNVLEGVPEDEFFVPTSLLNINVDNQSPIGYGMPAQAAALFFRSVAYETRLPQSGDWDRQVVASYPQDGILLMGWMHGEEKIARKAAIVDAGYKEGRVILIGFRAQHRGQTHGTYKFLFNALLYQQSN